MFTTDTPGQSFSAAPDSAAATIRAQFEVPVIRVSASAALFPN
jgi:hypothetical protein